MDKETKYVLLEVGSKEELKEYSSLEKVFEDLTWKCPSSFWIGVVEEKQAYTIPQFLEKYEKEYEKYELGEKIINEF